jgi:hypothetical protein
VLAVHFLKVDIIGHGSHTRENMRGRNREREENIKLECG